MKVLISTDGGARGNPGPAATGIVITNATGQELAGYGEYLGHQTNNYAEYMALISALSRAKTLGATEADCFMDSKLVVEQMKGNWRVKEPHLQKLFMQVYNLAKGFKKVTFTHIRREKNKDADRWVNITLDAQQQ